MSAYKMPLRAIVMATAAGWPVVTNAQDAANAVPPNTETVTELPEMVVEAPAKRNVKKLQLRKSGPARAASQAAAAAAPEPAGALEQQVVEGEKVVRTVRDSTTSIGVVTGKAIAERQIRDLDEAIEQTANVVTSEDPNTGFSIRGLSSEGQTGQQHISGVPLIGVVIDGATQNPDAVRRGARGLWDVEQVEVLRGPQSTLQGRNALGGTVNVKTNDPTYKLGAIFEGTVGTNDLMSGGFVLNAPIVAGQSAFRISGYTTERMRDIDYADPANEEMGWDSYDTLRAKLLIEPDSLPGFSALFTVSRTNDEPGSAFVSGPNFLARELNSSAAYTDFREGAADNYVADLAYEFAPGYTLHSVTAYADTETLIKTAAAAEFIRDGDNTDGKDFTQDLRLEMANAGNGLSGVVGLFYGYFERDNLTNTSVNTTWVAEQFGAPPGAPDNIISFLSGTNRSQTTSVAAYADLRYRWNRWVFNAGGRLLRDEVLTDEDSVTLDTNTFADYIPVEASTKQAFNEFLPKIGLTYDLTENQTLGVSYNKGYRAGFKQLTLDEADPNVQILGTVNPEYMDAYEVSYRSNWFSKSFDLNANAFYYDYQDQQIAVLDRFFDAEIQNAGSSHAYGAELEARWRPLAPLQLYASIGWLQSEFDEFEVRGNDYSGNEYPVAPTYTVSAGAMYRSSKGWFAGADIHHTEGYFSALAVANDPRTFVDAYTIVDARLGWEWEHYTLTVFAKNLFDEKYLTSVKRFEVPLDPAYGFIGDERTVGVTMTSRF